MKRSTRSRISRRGRAAAGLALVEVAISAALGVFLIGAGLSATLGAQATYSRSALQAAVQMEATRVADRIVEELAPCGASTLSVVPVDAAGNGPYLVAQACTGFDGVAKTWGPPFLIGFEKDPSVTPLPNLASAVPSAAGGLLDDLEDAPPTSTSLAPLPNVSTASVVMIAGGLKTILGSNLASDGLQVAVEGRVISFRVEIERPVPGKAPVRARATRAARLAN